MKSIAAAWVRACGRDFTILSLSLYVSKRAAWKSHERIRPWWKNWKSGNSLDEIAKSKWPSLKKFRRRPLSWTLRFYRAVANGCGNGLEVNVEGKFRKTNTLSTLHSSSFSSFSSFVQRINVKQDYLTETERFVFRRE